MPHLTEGFSGMTDLTARIESADGPSRELDVEIDVAINWGLPGVKNHSDPKFPGYVITEYNGRFSGGPAPRYTASIDAALTLVPGSDEHTSVFWQFGNDGAGGNPADFLARLLICTNLTSHEFRAVASTPALALAAAALKARGV